MGTIFGLLGHRLSNSREDMHSVAGQRAHQERVWTEETSTMEIDLPVRCLLVLRPPKAVSQIPLENDGVDNMDILGHSKVEGPSGGEYETPKSQARTHVHGLGRGLRLKQIWGRGCLQGWYSRPKVMRSYDAKGMPRGMFVWHGTQGAWFAVT